MSTALKLTDFEPSVGDVRTDVLAGLNATQKTLPTAFLYDERGSHLFEAICELPEYYSTRTELAIMDSALPEIAERVGPDAMIIEYGSGAGVKTRHFLEALQTPVAYAPVEISREHLLRSAKELDDAFPAIEVLPVCADFTQSFKVPEPQRKPKRRVVYFPGSTIGNFERPTAVKLLQQMRKVAGLGGGALLGVDLRKDVAVLEAAYNDAQGVTAEFNLNLLRRANAELDANFNVDAFSHKAVWVESRGAIEMRLYSKREQTVSLGGHDIRFAEGEWIHTEDSHKYSLDGFAELAAEAGFERETVWMDENRLFSIQLFR